MGEDEERLRQALRAERPDASDLQAISRLRDGLARRTFLTGGRARGLRMLASSLVFAVAALVVAGALLAPRLGEAGRAGQVGPAGQVGQAVALAGEHLSRLVGGRGRRDEFHAIQCHLFHGILRDQEMAEMDRVERSPEYADSFAFARHDRADTNQTGAVSQIIS